MIITDEEKNEYAMSKLEKLITRESFACQYKLTRTCQCENTISSVFTLLQSNNPLLIFEGWRGGQESLVGGGAAPPPPAAYGPDAMNSNYCMYSIYEYSAPVKLVYRSS